MDEFSALPSCIQPRKTRNLSTPFWKSNQNPLGRPKATMLSFTQPISNQKKKEMEPRQEKKEKKNRDSERWPLRYIQATSLPCLWATGFVPQLLKTTKKLELILTACSYFS
jgi:hypothetical protein